MEGALALSWGEWRVVGGMVVEGKEWGEKEGHPEGL